MTDERPNPDALLAAIQQDEASRRRGKLKVFLGMSPGVGKTFAMLEAARRELAAGRDLVVGYVETHGRAETDALAQGLPEVPRRRVEYRGVTLTELDLDAVLARKPQLVLVDEAIMEVANTGPGIAPDQLPLVFDPFFRGTEAQRARRDGCGLGLSIAQWIARAHGGSMQIASFPQKLTTVTVGLPLMHSVAATRSSYLCN